MTIQQHFNNALHLSKQERMVLAQLLWDSVVVEQEDQNLGEAHMPMSVDEFNSQIDQSLQDSKEGKVIDANTLLDRIRQWD